jgi:hypothetical protein
VCYNAAKNIEERGEIEMAMDFKKMKIDDIIEWCVANNQVAWLKAKAKETVKVERYTGKVKVEKNGKEVLVADKNSAKVTVEAPITFIQLKMAFVEKFMPEIAPKKSSNASMYDKIAAL